MVIQWAYGNPPLQVQFKDSLNNPVRSSSGAPRRAAPLPCPFNLARDSFAWLASRELLAHDEKSERKENAKIRFASYLDDEFAAIFDVVLAGLFREIQEAVKFLGSLNVWSPLALAQVVLFGFPMPDYAFERCMVLNN